ncbi:type VII secretion-associated protein [Corynebacterium lubricantis]|uniref:type VII secretion-associated protein n=1 Tax=Corynebacterium lubricantis TaxID=541095 RepID=UPI00036C67C0|nr:type VII secretion-associated protein [Corynebacterium lubricantis]
MSTILISIQPSVTVITAETSFYRYDNPSPAELAEYCVSLAPTAPEECTVAVSATADVAQQVVDECAARGFQIGTFPLHDDPPATSFELEPVAVEEEPASTDITRPAATAAALETGGRRGSMLILSVAVVGVLAAGLWAITTTSSDNDAPAGVAQVEDVEGDEDPDVEQVHEPTVSPDETTEQQTKDTVILNEAGLSVELPVGFQLLADGDMWKAEGDDPDLRLQLAVDDLFGLPPEELLSQVESEIEMDPELSLISVDAARIEYHQNAPDGSEATWITWVEDGKQVSLGCHTRVAPSTVQRATCTMARDSADFSGDFSGDSR